MPQKPNISEIVGFTAEDTYEYAILMAAQVPNGHEEASGILRTDLAPDQKIALMAARCFQEANHKRRVQRIGQFVTNAQYYTLRLLQSMANSPNAMFFTGRAPRNNLY